MMAVDDDTYDALYWVIAGVLEVGLMYALLRPLEALMPEEMWREARIARRLRSRVRAGAATVT